MNTQDRLVVKALLQYMTDKYLYGSDEFQAAIKHFNITTTLTNVHTNFSGGIDHVTVGVHSPDSKEKHGDVFTFATEDEANTFVIEQRAQGDDSTAAMIKRVAEKTNVTEWGQKMTRTQKLNRIWAKMHTDYKGVSDGVRMVLVCRGGTVSVPLDELTDQEIEARACMWQSAPRKEGK